MISSSTQKGEIACLKFESRAIEKGFVVSKPTIDCNRYDRVIDCNGKLFRVQIKYSSRKNTNSDGSTSINLTKVTRNGKKLIYTEQEIDVVVAYIPEIDKLCWLPSKLFHKKLSISIRYRHPKNHQRKGIVLADHYIW